MKRTKNTQDKRKYYEKGPCNHEFSVFRSLEGTEVRDERAEKPLSLPIRGFCGTNCPDCPFLRGLLEYVITQEGRRRFRPTLACGGREMRFNHSMTITTDGSYSGPNSRTGHNDVIRRSHEEEGFPSSLCVIPFGVLAQIKSAQDFRMEWILCDE